MSIEQTDQLLSEALYAALNTPLAGKAFYRLAPQGAALPYVVWQFQTMTPINTIGNRRGAANCLIKAFGATPKSARDTLALTIAPLGSLAKIGYTITAYYLGSPALPLDGNVWQVGNLYDLQIEAN